MKTFLSSQIRNVVLLGHSGEGKTSLAETMLYNCKSTDRMGRVDDGTSVMDYDAEEINRKISISLSVAYGVWNDTKINILDTPGFFDFEGEVVSALHVADAAIVVNGAGGTLPVGTEKALDNLKDKNIPTFLFINGINKENANYNQTISAIKEKFSNILPLEIPIIQANSMTGYISVLDGKAYNLDGSAKDIPADLKAQAEEALFELTELAAESDDALLEKYFDGQTLTSEELIGGIKKACAEGRVILSLCGAAVGNIGVTNLLNAINNIFPAPALKSAKAYKGDTEIQVKCDSNAAFSAQVFKAIADPFVGKLLMFKVMSGVMKTGDIVYNVNAGKQEKIAAIYIMKGKKQEIVSELYAGDIGALAKLSYTNNGDTLSDKGEAYRFSEIQYPKPVISLHVTSEKQGDEEKVINGLNRLLEEDSTFSLVKNQETGQMLLSGLGEMQLDVICKKLKNKFNVEAKLEDPKIPYRETIRKTVEQQGKHKKQSGGHGQYGDVHIRFEPNPDGGFEFAEEIVGGTVPKQYFPAVEKGLRESIQSGVLAGYPVVDIKATLFFGSYHDVDSSEMAFKLAANIAYREGLVKAAPVLLEPIYKAEVTVPESYMGDILGDLNKRRGRILGMEPTDNKQKITAEVPLAEMFKYATDLRSMTQGRGSFSMEFVRYEEVPSLIAKKIVEEAQKNKSE
ncbi:MAG: elongation factor G [Christensenellales bacterium]|jgi:elongation factor G